MRETKSLEARIRQHYDSLPPAEKRLGELLLSFPGDIANYTASELAEMAGTSKAAATRLFQRLGYSDYNELRREVRGARRWGSPVYLAPGEADSDGRPRAIAAHLQQEADNLTRTLQGVRPDVLRAAASAVAKARRVFIVGFRNSRMLAFYVQRQLLLLRPDVLLLPGAGQTLGEDLVDLGPEDVLVVIGLRRRVALVPRIMEAARQQGARTLLLADPSANRTLSLADWTLICEVRATSIFDSYASAISVLNLLCTTIYRLDAKRHLDRLRRVESLHEDLDELDTYAWFANISE